MTSGGTAVFHYTRVGPDRSFCNLPYIRRVSAKFTILPSPHSRIHSPHLGFIMSPLSRSFRHRLSAVAASFLLAVFSVCPAFAANYDYTTTGMSPPWVVNLTQTDNFIRDLLHLRRRQEADLVYGASDVGWPKPIRRSAQAHERNEIFRALESRRSDGSAGRHGVVHAQHREQLRGYLDLYGDGCRDGNEGGSAVDTDVDPVGGKLRRWSSGQLFGMHDGLVEPPLPGLLQPPGQSGRHEREHGVFLPQRRADLHARGDARAARLAQSIDNATYQCSDGLRPMPVYNSRRPHWGSKAVHRALRWRGLPRRWEVFRHPELTRHQAWILKHTSPGSHAGAGR